MLGWLGDKKGIQPHVPVWDKAQRQDGSFSRTDFVWNEQRNEYCFPTGKVLRGDWRPFKNPRAHITKADTVIYRASVHDCASCPLKARCCRDTPTRKIARSVHESA